MPTATLVVMLLLEALNRLIKRCKDRIQNRQTLVLLCKNVRIGEIAGFSLFYQKSKQFSNIHKT